MAKNVGLIQFNGALGDLVSYERNGVQVIQRKGGFTAARIKTEERYAAVRKRQSEFGKCAKISSVLRQALLPWLQPIGDKMIYNRIQSMVMGVKNCDLLSEKGAKTFEKGLRTAAGASLFRKFQFNAKRSLDSNVMVTQNFDFATGKVTVVPHGYKMGSKHFLAMELLVLSLDLETYDYELHSSGMQHFKEMHVAPMLEAVVPTAYGFCAAFLFVSQGVKDGTTMMLLRDRGLAFGVLDFQLV